MTNTDKIKIALLVKTEYGTGEIKCDNVIEVHTVMSYETMEKTMHIIFKDGDVIERISILEKNIIGYDLITSSEVWNGK